MAPSGLSGATSQLASRQASLGLGGFGIEPKAGRAAIERAEAGWDDRFAGALWVSASERMERAGSSFAFADPPRRASGGTRLDGAY